MATESSKPLDIPINGSHGQNDGLSYYSLTSTFEPGKLLFCGYTRSFVDIDVDHIPECVQDIILLKLFCVDADEKGGRKWLEQTTRKGWTWTRFPLPVKRPIQLTTKRVAGDTIPFIFDTNLTTPFMAKRDMCPHQFVCCVKAEPEKGLYLSVRLHEYTHYSTRVSVLISVTCPETHVNHHYVYQKRDLNPLKPCRSTAFQFPNDDSPEGSVSVKLSSDFRDRLAFELDIRVLFLRHTIDTTTPYQPARMGLVTELYANDALIRELIVPVTYTWEVHDNECRSPKFEDKYGNGIYQLSLEEKGWTHKEKLRRMRDGRMTLKYMTLNLFFVGQNPRCEKKVFKYCGTINFRGHDSIAFGGITNSAHMHGLHGPFRLYPWGKQYQERSLEMHFEDLYSVEITVEPVV